MNSSETNQGAKGLDPKLSVDTSRSPAAVPESNSEPAIPNDTPAEEIQGFMTGSSNQLRNLQAATYVNLIYVTLTGAIENAAIPTSLIMGLFTVYLACENVKQIHKVPYRAITSNSLIRGRIPMSLGQHAIASGIMFLWNIQYLSITGGLTAWNRFDLFLFTMAFNIIVTLIIKMYLHYHNKHVVKRHCD